MEHVSETNLIKLSTGALSDVQRANIEAHLESCAECRAAFAKQRAVRDILGQWQVTGDSDLWPAVDRRLDERLPIISHPLRSTALSVGRVAAVVLVGLGLGHLAGRAVPRDTATPPAGAVTVSEQEALEALLFHVIESPSATGLATTVFDLVDEAPEQGGA